MKVDVIIPVYYTYDLLQIQLNLWKETEGEWTLRIFDNTPPADRKPIGIPVEISDRVHLYRVENSGIDGERHGNVLDVAVKTCTTDIVCIQDCDFFWLDKKVIEYMERYFSNGYRCVGTEMFYNDFKPWNDTYPERHGSLAPCVFGMFIERQLALQQTFVVTAHEGMVDRRETGWRLRERLIKERINTHVIPCVQHPNQKLKPIPNMTVPWFYVGNQNYIGVHLVGSTSYNKAYAESQIKEILTW